MRPERTHETQETQKTHETQETQKTDESQISHETHETQEAQKTLDPQHYKLIIYHDKDKYNKNDTDKNMLTQGLVPLNPSWNWEQQSQ